MIGNASVQSSTTEGADDSGRSRQQDADDDDGDRQSAAQPAEHLDEVRHQVLGHTGAVEHQAHEHEVGQCDQHPVGHDRPYSVDDDREARVVLQQIRIDADAVQQHTGSGEPQRYTAHDPGNRVAGEDQADKGQEHQNDENLIGFHVVSPCGTRPRAGAAS
jgi:hypothetical protein